MAAGDVVEIDLPPFMRLLQSHPLVEETRNQVAVMRAGGLLLESPDLPEEVRPIAVALTQESQFTVDMAADGPLAGIAQLAGTGLVQEGKLNWSAQLYQEIQPVVGRTIPSIGTLICVGQPRKVRR
ncbi:MAG: hypothetical protein R2932_12960 [Caldilineaceae bacterium]